MKCNGYAHDFWEVRERFDSDITDMSCPKCNGVVGPHSDMCLDCGYDTGRISVKQ